MQCKLKGFDGDSFSFPTATWTRVMQILISNITLDSRTSSKMFISRSYCCTQCDRL